MPAMPGTRTGELLDPPEQLDLAPQVLALQLWPDPADVVLGDVDPRRALGRPAWP